MLKAMRLLIVTLALSLMVIGCSNNREIQSLTPVAENSARPAATPAPAAQSTAAEDGRNVFIANCTGCHGKNADANTPAGKAWHVPDLHSAQVQSMGDQQLLQIIHEGRGKMPAWGGLLSQTDIENVLAYVRSLKAQP